METPTYVEPMLATLGSLPLAGRDEDWVFEKKWDGIRAIVGWDGAELTVRSRNELDRSAAYPELAGLGREFGRTPVILDGEVVALEPGGRSSFSLLQRRTAADPIVLEIFDVLYLDGHWLLDLPWRDRRSVLEGLDLDQEAWRTPAPMAGTAAEAFAESGRERLEGVVAKRRDSLYRPGRRSPEWIKLKNVRTQEVVVGGWRAGSGTRDGTIGALLLGLPEKDGLRYVGRVGTGFTQATLADLLRRLTSSARATNPFLDIPRVDARDAHWVRPDLVGEVAFTEWTQDDRLRHPAWRGLRPDKTVGEVRRES